MSPSPRTAQPLAALSWGFCSILASLALLGLPVAASAADTPLKSFDVPAGEASTTLKLFASQAGQQVVFAVRDVRGIQTVAVKGDLPLRAALDRMLANTDLVGTFDEKSSTFAVRKETETESKNVNRVIAQNHDRPKNPTNEIKDGVLVLDAYEVTGSHIRGVLGEATIQPVLTFTHTDLARMGLQTISDLRNYIPQLPSVDWNNQPGTSFQQTSQGQVDNFGQGLRGLGGSATLVLVNGRRVNKIGQSQSGAETYSAAGVPFSSIERVEILTTGASAIYGADALAGVINIILKKEYQGTELVTSYGNTFDTDTAYRNIQLTHGFRSGKLSIDLSAGWTKTNSLAPRDRWWTASANKLPYGGTDGRARVPAGTGDVRTANGANLPGLTTSAAAIPTNANGLASTVADYGNAGPIEDRFDTPQYLSYGQRSQTNIKFGGDYAFRPWLTAFWDAQQVVSKSSNGTGNIFPVLGGSPTLTIPAGYPGNPFGISIRLERPFYELFPLLGSSYETKTYSALIGVRGFLPNSWHYEASIEKSWSSYNRNTNGTYSSSLVQSAVNNADPALRPILLNNGLLYSPNSTATLLSFMSKTELAEQPINWLYEAKADGPIWSLPSGDVQLAVGSQINEEYVDFPSQSAASITLSRPNQRTSVGTFAEINIPIFGEKQHVAALHRLEVNLSVRSDTYSDFHGKIAPRYSMIYYPVKSLALRASYGRGYKVPTLYDLYGPLSEGSTVLGSSGIFGPAEAPVLDPLRGNQPLVDVIMPSSTGGNSTLRPERSRNISAGVVVEVSAIRGLSFSVDYFDIVNIDRVAGLGSQSQLLLTFFPERVTRAAPSLADTAAGFAGEIIHIDKTNINIAEMRAAGFDAQLQYNFSVGRLGEFSVRSVATLPTKSLIQVAPTSATFSDLPGRPLRLVGTVTWRRSGMQLGTTTVYTHPYMSGVSATNPGLQVPGTVVWDCFAAYDFTQANLLRRFVAHRWNKGLKLSVNLYNVLNKEPYIRLGSAFGNLDPRGRRYQITLTKSF